jgi:hypothetical protein
MMTNYSSDYQRTLLQHKKQVQRRAQPHPDDVHYRNRTLIMLRVLSGQH